jgi:hypothetical protein
MSDRVLGEVLSYADLHGLLRGRAEELGLSRETLDEISGLQPGYSSKLLSARPIKKLGFASMPALLPALGVKLVLMVDEQQTAALQRRITAGTAGTRRAANVRVQAVHQIVFTRRRLQKMGRKGGANSRAYMTPRQASELGKRAAYARWADR